MNKNYTVITPQHQLYSPTAGWLSKMVSLPFGRSRWISRYFVLLDSELRFYKDEYSEVASQVLNLRQIAQVIPASTLQHPFCFRLEPKQQLGDHVLKPWIVECKSEIDMETWICAIQSRIIKYSPAPSPLLLHQKSPTEVYRMPTLPLRCTNMIRGEEDDSTKESLLSRRNKKLAPIVTQPSTSSFICSPQPSLPLYSCSLSAASSTSTLPSPTGAVLGCSLPIPPAIIDRYSNHTSKDAGSNQVPLVAQEVLGVQHQEKKECDTISLESSSPTYLMYKKRFRL